MLIRTATAANASTTFVTALTAALVTALPASATPFVEKHGHWSVMSASPVACLALNRPAEEWNFAPLPRDAISGVATAVAIEDYPDRVRGPSVLALQQDANGDAIHVVWAIPAGQRRPAVLVTAYRPDAALWDSDFKQRTIR